VVAGLVAVAAFLVNVKFDDLEAAETGFEDSLGDALRFTERLSTAGAVEVCFAAAALAKAAAVGCRSEDDT